MSVFKKKAPLFSPVLIDLDVGKSTEDPSQLEERMKGELGIVIIRFCFSFPFLISFFLHLHGTNNIIKKKRQKINSSKNQNFFKKILNL